MQMNIGCCCTGAKSVLLPIYRLVETVAPLTPELGIESGTWEYRPDIEGWNWRVNLFTQGKYFNPSIRRFVYFATSPPFRWKYGWQTGKLNGWWGINGSTANLSLSHKTFHIPFREGLLPSDSHCAGRPIDHITIPGNLLWSAANLSLGGAYFVSRIAAYRVLINGQDVTGIVHASDQLSVGRTNLTGPWHSVAAWGSVAFTHTGKRLAIPEGFSMADATVEYDLWFYTESSSVGGFVEPWAVALSTTWNHSNDLRGYGVAESGTANRAIPRNKKWRITPSADNSLIGGLSSVVTESQAGWTVLTAAETQVWMRYDASGNTLLLDWGREVPQLVVENKTVPTNAGGFTWGEVRYIPTTKSDYQPVPLHTDGVWNPQGTTVFERHGRHRVGDPTQSWWWPTKQIDQWDPAYVAGYPDFITVEKV